MNERILIIDDETNIRTMMKLALAHSGYHVATASDGREGLEIYGNGENHDLVLLDQRMPGMPGIEVQKVVFNRNPQARLIVITAFGTIDLAVETIREGASDFLRKPFTADTLRASVRSALDRPLRKVGDCQPVGTVCREFTRTTINGFSFELDGESIDDRIGDITCEFEVHRTSEDYRVSVILPAYVQELVKAYTDSETVPGGMRFWHAMCEEALANHLWQNATPPEGNTLRIEDLSTSLQRWLDSMLTVSVAYGR
ncbi:response regulator [bacterium]|nr:MAG: response regulator [bacterium]